MHNTQSGAPTARCHRNRGGDRAFQCAARMRRADGLRRPSGAAGTQGCARSRSPWAGMNGAVGVGGSPLAEAARVASSLAAGPHLILALLCRRVALVGRGAHHMRRFREWDSGKRFFYPGSPGLVPVHLLGEDWIGRTLMFRNETWPWSPCKAMYPVLDFAKFGIDPNLLAATRVLKSSLPRTYSKYFTPLISCTHFSGVMRSRTWFHWPTGLVASRVLPVLGSIGG